MIAHRRMLVKSNFIDHVQKQLIDTIRINDLT